MEPFHQFVSIDGGLEVAYAVFLFEGHQFLSDGLKVLQEITLTHFVFAGNVGFAQKHQVVNVVARLKQESPYGAVGDVVGGNYDRAHVQIDEFIDVFHTLVKWQFKAPEQRAYHLCPYVVVVMKRPARAGFKLTGLHFPNIMQERSPPEKKIVGASGHAVHYFERMVEVVLMRFSGLNLDVVQSGEFGQYERQQTASVQFDKAYGGYGGGQYLAKLLTDAFLADNMDSFAITLQGVKSLVVYAEIQLRSKSYTAQHTQRIVGKGDVRVEWSANNTVLQVFYTPEGIYKVAEVGGIELRGQGIDGKISPILVVFERTVLYDGFPAASRITLFARTDKFEFCVLKLDLCRTEITEYAQMSLFPEIASHGFGHFYAGTYDNDVNVVGRPVKQNITHIAPYHIAGEAERIGYAAYALEDGIGEQDVTYFFFRVFSHRAYYSVVQAAKLGKNQYLRNFASHTRIFPSDMNLQAELNDSQREAVVYDDGPLLIIAGAGSGKTRVLTYKIAHLLEQGYAPMRIMALTFTNKAAREMCDRIFRLVGNNSAQRVWAGTFHSVFARILRIEHNALGISADFTIYDQGDSRQLLKHIIKEMGLDDKVYKPAFIASRISAAKNRLVLPDAYVASPQYYQRDRNDDVPQLGAIYRTYMERLHQSDALDFDDLLLFTYLLLERNEDIRRKYQERFEHILVDEYQDTNIAQFRIIRLLSPEGRGLSVVGDDAQSIYGFRGAEIDNILTFTKTYPATRTVKLERNYRSTQNIVALANSVIAHNRRRIPKEVFSQEGQGAKVQLFSTYSDKDEAYRVAREIGRLQRLEHVPNNEIAVLYRTNAQSRSFEEVFQERDIPFRIFGGLAFYQRKEIKDLLAYLRLINNPRDDEAFARIINYPARGIGATTVQKVRTAARAQAMPLFAVASNPLQYGVEVNAGAVAKLQAFAHFILHYRSRQHEVSAYDLATHIFQDTRMAEDFSREGREEALAKNQNVREFLSSIRAFEQERLEETGEEWSSLNTFLSHVSLLTDLDEGGSDEPRVSLMTIHAAKGLEFSAVFVTGLEDDLFPAPQAKYSEREKEEERRLFYVALTRAKEFCYISYAKTRFRYGNVDQSLPSPFLDELDSTYLQRDDHSGAYSSKPRPTVRKPSIFENYTPPRPAPAFKPLRTVAKPTEDTSLPPGLSSGCRIRHERFGEGTVRKIEGQGGDTKLTVDFDNAGTKMLLLKFARFTVL